MVSFNRPYGHDHALDARGSGDYLGNELPLRLPRRAARLDVSYWTDVDLDRHRTGWSTTAASAQPRSRRVLVDDDAQARARRRNDQGVNLAFLGANACYRQIRFAGREPGDRRR